jgi:cytochrome c peroxidase
LFFDTRLSADNQISCATCHLPDLAFTDGRKLGRGVGTAGRNTMTILGSAYSPWLFWDGRKDSLWSQALSPTESALEHGGTRSQFAHIVATDPTYRSFYRVVFGPLPDLSDRQRFRPAAGPVDDVAAAAAWDGMTAADRATVTAMFANIGKAIAAYERRLVPGPSRFDDYVAAVLDGDDAGARAIYSDDEAAGLRLFIGRGQCTRCHNGPLFSNFTFHNTGVPPWPGTQPDQGRSAGVTQVLEDPFNCLGEFSDAGANDCGELRFAKTSGADLVGAVKTPSLRNISKTAPYMHAGQYAILDSVLDHYNRAPEAAIGTSELLPLGFAPADLAALKSFLLTLDSPPALDRADLTPPD